MTLDAASGDPALEPEVVLDLVRRHVPGAGRVTGIDESGRKGRAYFIDDGIVLKTQRPVRLRGRAVEEFETSLEKEAFFLRQMAADSVILAPRPLGYGRAAQVEYVCMTRVDGVSLRRNEVPPEHRARALRGLGAMLHRVHDLPQQPFRASGLFPDEDGSPGLRRRLEILLRQLCSAHAELTPEWRLRLSVEDVAASALAHLPNTTVRAALHSNPAAEHVYVDPASGRLLGLIDFADAYISHPAFDLRPWREPPERAAVIDGYASAGPVDAGFLATWRAGMICGAFAAVLRRREAPEQADLRLRGLLAELGAS